MRDHPLLGVPTRSSGVIMLLWLLGPAVPLLAESEAANSGHSQTRRAKQAPPTP